MASNQASASTSSHKTRDDARSSSKSIALDWWDFQSESARRPVAWSRNSVQFSAHDTQAQVVGCVFPSQRTFALPIPQPILNAPLSYAPPTIITAASPLRDEYECLFAYFPPRAGGMPLANDAEAGGVGCVYYNSSCLADGWVISQHWHYQRNGGAVAARWIGNEREWTCHDGQFARMPRMGPPTPLTNPTLALVTQSHTLCIYYRSHTTVPRGANLMWKMLAASLKAMDHREENKPAAPQTAVDKGMGLRLCKHAAVGLGYSEDSIIVAMHSELLPSCPPPSTTAASLGLSAPPTHLLEPHSAPENETYGDEPSIELCEVRLLVQRQPLTSTILAMQVVQTFPISPIADALQDQDGVQLQMKGMAFVPRPPALADAFPDTRMFLGVAAFDYGDYSSALKSRIALYALNLNPHGNRFGYFKGAPQRQQHAQEAASMKAPLWVHALVARRDFPEDERGARGVAVSLGVCDLHSFCVATINADARYRANGPRGVVVGEMVVLRIPDLEFDPQRKPTPLYGAVQHSLITLPLATTLSTNEVLLASVPPWSPGMTHHPPTIHPFPVSPASLPEKLACALIARRSAVDIVHTVRTQPPGALSDLLHAAARLLDAHAAAAGLDAGVLQGELVRLAVEVYKRRDESDRGTGAGGAGGLELRYKAGVDLCYLMGAASVFEACEEDGAWDLKAVWQLIAVMKWTINLVERLARECVYLEGEMLLSMSHRAGAGGGNGEAVVKPDPDAPPPAPANPHPSLFLLLHPLPLATLLRVLKNIESFRLFVESSRTKSENAYIARQSVLDCVQLSPLNLGELKSAVENLLTEVEGMDVDHRRRTISMLAPAPELHAQLPALAARLTAPGLVDKPRLFYESAAPTSARKAAATSVLTRTPLDAAAPPPRVCMRCGGRAEPFGHALVIPGGPKTADKSVRLEAWMKQWNTRCLCGGRWIKSS